MTRNSRSMQGADILVILGGSLFGVAVVVTGVALLPALAPQIGLVATESSRAIVNVSHDEAGAMGLPAVGDTPAYWYMARAGGIVAYMLLFLATFWGVAMSGKMAKGALKPSFLYGMHQFFPSLAVVFAMIHAASLLGDQSVGFRPVDLLLPFGSSYEPLWTGLGTLAIYLLVALIASFYVRKWIGRRVWRAFHFLAYVAFLLALVHGIMAGSDGDLLAIRMMYLLTGALILFATSFRILTRSPTG
jgi:sulfoxide reductase heme-binding subunit YedZ